MNYELPTILITGASGFVGRYLIENIRDEFNVIGIARRSMHEAGIPYHQNLRWLQCDISDLETVNNAKQHIIDFGGADFIVHLAAYYDFTYKDDPEYERTNIIGTKNILELAKEVKPQRFIFASSIAACEFPSNGNTVNEKTSPNANYHYARSKKIGESLVRNHSQYFSTSVLRFAAIYSDWCEFAPLYKFLSNWLSKNIDSKILGGKGESAIPYIHVHDVCRILKKIVKETGRLPGYDIYNVSGDGSTSHKELFELATRYYFGESIKPYYIPKILTYPGLVFKHLFKHLHLTCEQPFERFWMIKYIDKKLDVDASYTRKVLEWQTESRYHINRRLLFLLEKMKSHPEEWKMKNEAALNRVARRANLILYEEMVRAQESLVKKITDAIFDPKNKAKFSRYGKMNQEDCQCYISTLYHLLMATVRSGDRSLMLKYIDDIAVKRFAEGFQPHEICETLRLYSDLICDHLGSVKEIQNIKQEIYDYVGLTIQLAQDEVEDLYENLLNKISIEKIAESPLLPDCTELKKMIRQLSAFYQINPNDGNHFKDLIDNY